MSNTILNYARKSGVFVYTLFLVLSSTAQNYITRTNEFSLDDNRFEKLLKEYKQGKNDFSSMPFMIRKADELRRFQLARTIATDYMNNYLAKLPVDKLLTRENLDFVRFNLKTSNSSFFSFFNSYKQKIDSVMQETGYADKVIIYVVTLEEVNDYLVDADKNDLEINWTALKEKLEKEYGKYYSGRIVLDAEIRWYSVKKDWERYSASIVKKVETYGPFGFFPGKADQFNQCAWEIFLHSHNKSNLTTAVGWIDSAILLYNKPNEQFLDTKANLLYKAGKNKEAIIVEEKATLIAPWSGDIANNLEKMKKRLPTWPIDQ